MTDLNFIDTSSTDASDELLSMVRDKAQSDVVDRGLAVLGSPLFALAGAVDTVGQSVGLLGDDSMVQGLSAISNDVGRVYEKNRSGFRMAGDVATMFGGIGLTSKVLRSGSMLDSALRRSGKAGEFARKVIISDNDAVQAMVYKVGKIRAADGTAMIRRESERAKKWRYAARKKQAVNDIKEGVAAEAGMAVYMNESELFFPDEMTMKDYGVMAVGGLGIGGAIGQMVLTPSLKRAAARAGQNAAQVESPVTGNLGTDIVSASYNAHKASSTEAVARTANERDLEGARQDFVTENKAKAKRSAEALGKMQPVDGLSSDVSLTASQATLITDELALSAPALLNNALSVEAAGVGRSVVTQRSQIVTKLDKQIADLDLKIKGLTDAGDTSSGEYVNLTTERKQRFQQKNEFENNIMGVEVSAIGTVTTDVNRKQTILDTSYDVSGTKVKINRGTGAPDQQAFFAIPKNAGEKQHFGITAQGTPIGYSPATKKLETYNAKRTTAATPKQITQFYASMPRALRELDSVLKDSEKLATVTTRTKVSSANSHVELDYAIAAVQRNGGSLGGDISAVFDFGGFGSLEEMKLASLDQKFQWFQKRKALEAKDKRIAPFTAEDFTHSLNLRMTDDYGSVSPAMEWFEDLRAAGITQLRTSVNGYRDALLNFQRHFVSDAPAGSIKEVYGSDTKQLSKMERMLEMGMVERFEKPVEPFSLLVRRDGGYGDRRAADHLAVARIVEDQRMGNIKRYIGGSSNPVASQLLGLLDQQAPLLERLREAVSEMSPGTERGYLVESLGQLGPGQKTFRGEYVPGLEEASALSDTVQRQTARWLAEDFKVNTAAIARMRNPDNVASAHLYGLYETAMQKGWELADDAVPANGLFPLAKDSRRNSTVARAMGLDDVPEFMPSPLGLAGSTAAPLKLDQIALDALKEMRRYDQMLYDVDAGLLRSMGKGPEVAYRKGHSVIPNRFGQEMAFVTDQQGKVVNYVLGASAQEAKKRALKVAEGLPKGHGVIASDSVEAYKHYRDEVWNSHTFDVSDSFAKDGAKARGSREGLVIDGAEYAKAQLEQVRQNFNRMSTRVLEHYFLPEMEQLKLMQHVVKDNKLGLGKKKSGDDVFDLFRQVLTNTNDPNEGSLYGALNEVAEQAVNTTLTAMRELAQNTRPSSNKVGTAQASKIAQQLEKEFGYNPVAYAERLASQELGGNQSATTARQIVNQAGYITQTLALKLFETGHAILTTASIGTTIPHNITWMRQMKGESVDARKARLGWMSDVLPDGTAIPSPQKMLVNTVHDMFNDPAMKEAIATARSKGYVDAPIGEFFELINGSVDGWAAKNWNRFMRVSGAISEKSEDFARVFSFAVGYNLARRSGKVNGDMALAFGNQFANRTIADYRPNQRAQVFQGFLGTPLALFQTFSVNYFQRLFSAVENKAYRTLLTQYGTQAFMFGGASVPGYDLFNETLLRNYDGSSSPDALFADNDIGALMQFGTLSNLPRLLGASDGIALHVRGEMQTPRNLTPWNLSETPAVQMFTRSMGVMQEGIKTLMSQGDVGGFDALQEALVLAMPNRPLRGTMELIQGYSLNANSDIVEDDTRQTMSVISRLIGMRPMMEAQKAKVLWDDRQADLAQRERKATLKRAVIASFRKNGKIDASEIAKIAERYVAYGDDNDLAGFRAWLKDAAVKATREKFSREAMKELRRNPESREALRFMGLIEDGALE